MPLALLNIPYYVTHVVGACLQATDAIAAVPVRRHGGSYRCHALWKTQ
jgi:NhaP-type Na+/H+ or K+/H+ antiporter